jgi:hypothetical protein
MYGRIEVWELATHDLVRPLTTGYGGSSRLCVFPNGKLAASAGVEETVTVWDLTFRANKATPQADELRKALDDLASNEASVGYPAVWVFVSAGNRGVDLLSKTVKEISTQEKKIRGWIEDLGSNTFRTRENAAKELVALGIRAIPALNAAIKSEDMELRDRAREVMEKLTAKGAQLPPSGMTGDSLRLFRAVKALEEIGTPEARTVLKSIADLGGKPGEEAKSVLTRMKR